MIKISVLALTAMLAGLGNAEGVKYRGIFINDEDWSLRPWAIKHFGKKQQIGTRVYEMVFKEMERYGLNLLWPAMHEGGYEFSERNENFEVAKKHGITIGTSHCEPMLRNNCYIPKKDHSLWSWTDHRDFIENYWREGVKRGENYDCMYTIGMRGIHDGRMRDGKDVQDKIRILEEVFAFQSSILPPGAPMLFCPYKEVLPLYNAGLKVPEEATIMWTNDNFGYIRRVGGPNGPKKQGIYWHVSYHGSPHGYIHTYSVPPAFMGYELCAKAWANGVRDVWMLNVGDVFQADLGMFAFGKFAANPESFGPTSQREILDEYTKTFNLQPSTFNLSDHLMEYFNLAFNRKPEHMCIQWTTNLPASVKSDLLKRYHKLLEDDLKIEDDEYFRKIGFQVQFLAHAGIIHLEGKDAEYAYSVLNPLYARWNKLEGGKWSGFWCDTVNEYGGKRQPTTHNRWSSQMQWPWNEPDGDVKYHGVARRDYPATAYRAEEEIEWIKREERRDKRGDKECKWVEIEGLGTSGKALALLPVDPNNCTGAKLVYPLSTSLSTSTLVLQFLPDFELWPKLGLGVKVRFDEGKEQYVEVPSHNSNLGEFDFVRSRAVQDNFVRVEVTIPKGAKKVTITSVNPGVVIDRVGVKK